MSRRVGAQLSASPVLVGAITVLIVIVAVVISYGANQGLPFVPTYDLRAELPGGSNLVVGNDVRVGGFRVGQVDRIEPAVAEPEQVASGSARAIALVHLKLDKQVEPLPVDTRVAIRPRSALGLKYIELTLGGASETYQAGATIPLERSLKPVELDDFFSIYDEEFRVNQRATLGGYGDALAGRGEAINRTIEGLVPFMRHLEPVMRTLSDRETRLGDFLRQSRQVAGQIAPVASSYAALFGNMATTFDALTRDPEALRDTLERAAPTLETGIDSFPVIRPFLKDTEELARRLEPVADEIESSLPLAGAAVRTGAPVLLRAPPFYERSADLFGALEDLSDNPNTLLALSDLRRAFELATPLVNYVAPYQTVCNYWVYFWTASSEHLSELVPGGTIQRTNLKSGNLTQDNRIGGSEADRPADVPANLDPQTAVDANGDPLQALHRGAYEPAIDAQGNADCQVGQRGYLEGPLVTGGRYPPSDDPEEGGGSHVVLNSDFPGLRGGTYKARELGIDNVEDVP